LLPERSRVRIRADMVLNLFFMGLHAPDVSFNRRWTKIAGQVYFHR